MRRLFSSWFAIKAPCLCGLLLGLLTGVACAEFVEVQWERLELSQDQKSNLTHLDKQWQNRYSEVVPRIHANEQKLRALMNSAHPDEHEIMRLQQQIHEDKMKLKMDATQIFLYKRRVLSREQDERLMQMMKKGH